MDARRPDRGVQESRSMGRLEDLERFQAPDRRAWREWLGRNHESSPGVWLVYYKKGSGKPSVTYEEAVEEALCFGWIDSTVRSLDEERYMQLATPRKPRSHWSRSNKQRVERLIERGLMTAAGMRAVESAREDGSWTFLDPIEDLVIPDDLEVALEANPAAKRNFEALPDSVKKGILFWIATAKRDATRERRVAETTSKVAQGSHPLG
jgi:uncharacterized protein YdeI (YjbR/CyaY-like superfamily)